MGRKELLLDFIKYINHNDVITIYPSPRILNKKALVDEFLNQYENKYWIHRNDDYTDWLECPTCGYGDEGEVKYGKGTPYCPYCGERLYE